MQKGLSSKVVEAIKTLVRGLRSHGVRVERVLVFGSRVRGDWLKTSDIDVVLVSKDWKGMKFTERLDLVEKVQWENNIRIHIEAIPLTPEELEEGTRHSAVLRDASRYWIELQNPGEHSPGDIDGTQATTGYQGCRQRDTPPGKPIKPSPREAFNEALGSGGP